MSLRMHLLENSLFTFRNDIFYQKDLQRNDFFEVSYLQLRKNENRLYSDEVVRNLPEIGNDDRNKLEWEMRKSSLHKLIQALKRDGATRVLEVGSGNGWLSHNLAISLQAEICGIDVNETELLQAARIFKEQGNLNFIYGDIFNPRLFDHRFDTIILSGSVQYFADLNALLLRLLDLVNLKGAIYIVDSPIYASMDAANAARIRSKSYYDTMGFPDMASLFHHHTFTDFDKFNYEVNYNPRSLASLLQRKVLKKRLSIFPMIRVCRQDERSNSAV